MTRAEVDLAGELRALREQVARVVDPDRGPLDHKALMDRGYSEREAYGLLRAHGVKIPGGRRARISREVLEHIERGDGA